MLKRVLPDVTDQDSAEMPSTLKWVGMEGITVPITVKQTNDSTQMIIAKANVFVSLDASSNKGIHMSRLYIVINQLKEIDCNKDNIEVLLDRIVSSQNGISEQARIELSFDIILDKPALLSGERGFQSYPVVLITEKTEQGYTYELSLTIPYSSTCPCSASLARQLYANAIEQNFSGDKVDKKQLLSWVQSQAGSVATPHSQRSYAYIRLSFGDVYWPDITSLIIELEKIIGTPVQTAVRRTDEQEFARLNANNLMFCEDAARKIKIHLESVKHVRDYWFKIEHQESLHAHNAVVIEQKN